jgi:hypothetical protein
VAGFVHPELAAKGHELRSGHLHGYLTQLLEAGGAVTVPSSATRSQW